MEIPMKNTNDHPHSRDKIKIYIRMAAILCCTIIGGYGILKAPDSDENKMKQELLHNEQMLRQESEANSEGADTKASKQPDSASMSDSQIPKTPHKTISVIGDSVFLGAAPSFQKIQDHTVIDAKISRQVRHGLAVAQKLEEKGKLGDIIIIALGTNGNFNSATGQELIDYLGSARTVYWVNAYGKNLDCQREINDTIRGLCKRNSNVSLIPWAGEAKKHPEWFYQDGIHLNPDGQEGFAHFIKTQISPGCTDT